MSVYSRTCFQWSNQTYSLKQFETYFENKLPKIVMVTDGYSAPSSYYTFSSDDIYFVKELAKQPRLVVQDMEGRLLSIPFDYPIKVHVVKKVGPGDTVVGPAEKLSVIMKKNRNTLAGIDNIVFQHNETIQFEIGTENTGTANCGVMKLLDIYWERYYIGHSIMNDALMHPSEVVIPIYVPINFKIAEGLTVSGDMDFKQILTNAKKLATDFLDGRSCRANKLNPEIMLVTERDQDGYDYIVPKGWLKLSHKSSNDAMDWNARHSNRNHFEDYGLDSKKEHLLDIGVPLPQSPKKTHPVVKRLIGNGPKLPAKEPTSSFRRPLPNQKSPGFSSFKRPVPSPPGCQPDDFSTRYTKMPVPLPTGRHPVDLPARHTKKAVSLKSTYKRDGVALPTIPEGKLGKPGSEKLSFKQKLQAFGELDTLPGKPPNRLTLRPNCDGTESPGGINAVNRKEAPLSTRFQTLAEVPRDRRVLSIADVTHCLRLLGVREKCLRDVEKNQVDGTILHSLSVQDMKDDLGFSGVEATKAEEFSKGWNPKI